MRGSVARRKWKGGKKRKERKERRRGTRTNVVQGEEPDGKGLGTVLREVGIPPNLVILRLGST